MEVMKQMSIRSGGGCATATAAETSLMTATDGEMSDRSILSILSVSPTVEDAYTAMKARTVRDANASLLPGRFHGLLVLIERLK